MAGKATAVGQWAMWVLSRQQNYIGRRSDREMPRCTDPVGSLLVFQIRTWSGQLHVSGLPAAALITGQSQGGHYWSGSRTRNGSRASRLVTSVPNWILPSTSRVGRVLCSLEETSGTCEVPWHVRVQCSAAAKKGPKKCLTKGLAGVAAATWQRAWFEV